MNRTAPPEIRFLRERLQGDDVFKTVPDEGLASCLELLKEGNNVSAIKYLQAEYGMGLARAKQAVERLAGSMFDG